MIDYPLLEGQGGKHEDKKASITIATMRPETLFGDLAVAVHPDDERYRALLGKRCLVPLAEREVAIIADKCEPRILRAKDFWAQPLALSSVWKLKAGLLCPHGRCRAAIGSRNPADDAAYKDVLQGVVERVSDMQASRHIRRRHHQGVGVLSVVVSCATESTARLHSS